MSSQLVSPPDGHYMRIDSRNYDGRISQQSLPRIPSQHDTFQARAVQSFGLVPAQATLNSTNQRLNVRKYSSGGTFDKRLIVKKFPLANAALKAQVQTKELAVKQEANYAPMIIKESQLDIKRVIPSRSSLNTRERKARAARVQQQLSDQKSK